MDSTKLRDAVAEILASADLTTITAKQVRQILQDKYGSSDGDGEDFMSGRKKEIDEIVLELINEPTTNKNNGNNSSGVKRAAAASSSSSEDDEEEEKSTSSKKKKKPTTTKSTSSGGGSGTGFTRVLNLSPELAKLMGKERMARHEVVKAMWAMIKEKNLYDPKNKQYAICNEEMGAVFGVKRFRTFGMMKYLKNHFRD